jgi:hypothetical protein
MEIIGLKPTQNKLQNIWKFYSIPATFSQIFILIKTKKILNNIN